MALARNNPAPRGLPLQRPCAAMSLPGEDGNTLPSEPIRTRQPQYHPDDLRPLCRCPPEPQPPQHRQVDAPPIPAAALLSPPTPHAAALKIRRSASPQASEPRSASRSHTARPTRGQRSQPRNRQTAQRIGKSSGALRVGCVTAPTERPRSRRTPRHEPGPTAKRWAPVPLCQTLSGLVNSRRC
jgi:hypothetical protein